MTIIITQGLLFIGVLAALFKANSALRNIKKLSEATANTFGLCDKHITDLANNDAILADAIDVIIENSNLSPDEVYQD